MRMNIKLMGDEEFEILITHLSFNQSTVNAMRQLRDDMISTEMAALHNHVSTRGLYKAQARMLKAREDFRKLYG